MITTTPHEIIIGQRRSPVPGGLGQSEVVIPAGTKVKGSGMNWKVIEHRLTRRSTGDHDNMRFDLFGTFFTSGAMCPA